MAIFTKAEDLFSSAEQSVGGNPTEGGNGNESVRIFQPDRGLDVLIPNVGYLDREEGDFSTGVSASFDGRKTLGTITLNNRDFWENSNYIFLNLYSSTKIHQIQKLKFHKLEHAFH